MAKGARVAIVVHPHDPYPFQESHLVWSLARGWREAGIKVVVHRGSGRPPDADLLVAHVDLSVLPPDYIAMFAGHDRVLNGGVHDIRKSVVHGRLDPSQLVRTDCDWQGPVMVKTDLNFGGVPEYRFGGRHRGSYFLRELKLRQVQAGRRSQLGRAWTASGDQGGLWVRTRPPSQYEIFAHKGEVPAVYWRDPGLVVTRYYASTRDGLFHRYLYVFFGDRGYCIETYSTTAIAHAQSVVRRVPVDIHAEAWAARKAFGLDFGKIDYLVHEGKVVILDINKTPGNPFRRRALRRGFVRSRETLISGIHGFLSQAAAGRDV